MHIYTIVDPLEHFDLLKLIFKNWNNGNFKQKYMFKIFKQYNINNVIFYIITMVVQISALQSRRSKYNISDFIAEGRSYISLANTGS